MEFLFCCCFLFCLGVHVYTDIKEMLLYDKVSLALAAVGLLRCFWQGTFSAAVLGSVVLGVMMLVIYYASHGGLGEGDVKLAPVRGLWLGWQQGLVCLLLAFVSGALYGALLWLLGKAQSKSALPFGPFLCGGGVAAYFYGAKLVAWYCQYI